MQYRIFSENEWVYPDSSAEGGKKEAVLFAPRGADVCFQVLTDYEFSENSSFSFSHDLKEAEPVIYQLLPAYVSENSAADIHTTTNYESVKHFVTRQAPFTVYEITKPIEGAPDEGRAAFYVRLNIAKDATPGTHTGELSFVIDGTCVVVPVTLTIYHVCIPALSDSNFHMVNWLFSPSIENWHEVKIGTEEFDEILKAYFENLIDMRNDMVIIPEGVPVRDKNGRVVDFDFTNAERFGNLALSCGFKKIMGGFVARFVNWDDADQFLAWDRSLACTTIEAFRQLKIYFTRAWECVQKNGWGDRYMQSLVDEPQFPNSLSYRALSGICRQNMPGIKIHDPVETSDVAGALDVWVVKQAIFEKYREDFRALQDCGEEMWIYTCGYPGGKAMNRSVDLPLTVSRMPLWMCYKYGCTGFLHWGYNSCRQEKGKITDCCSPIGGTNLKFTPGNAHVVYNENKRPLYSVRGHLQRAGTYDYELFYQLGLKDKEKAISLIEKVCRTLDDYDPDAALMDSVRKELLEALG